MIHVVHVITTLTTGGAEWTLARLLDAWDRDEFSATVVSLAGDGPVGDHIATSGTEVVSLRMPRGIPDPRGLVRLVRLLRRQQPDVVQGWMYHANLVGGIAARLAGVKAIAWGIHHSDLDPATTKRRTRWTARAGARLANRLPHTVVCCSARARHVHAEIGYPPDKMIVVPNGFDLETFRPDPSARAEVRRELSVPDGAPLVGLTARFSPEKDHANFFAAAAVVSRRRPEARFVLCGPDVGAENPVLRELAERAGVARHTHLLGVRTDVPRITAALDVAVSASRSEAFPLSVGEAMACGVPAVVTDAGDSATIVGDTGEIVAVRDPDDLSEAILRMLSLGDRERTDLGLAARRRIEEHFSIATMVDRYEALYRGLTGNG